MKSALPLAILWLLAVTAFADNEVQEARRDLPFPKGGSVSLTLPESAVIGDHIAAQFVVKNAGPTIFTICSDNEITVQVKDAAGNILPETVEGAFFGSYIVAPIVLKPGDTKAIDFSLGQYAAIFTPGLYTISAWCNLGWKMDAGHPWPVAAAKIEFKAPTAEYAVERVHALSQKTDAGSVEDLRHLRSPVFVPALLAEGKAGHPQACIGLGGVVATEANEALIELLQSNDPKISKAAAVALDHRLPSLADPTTSATGWPVEPLEPILKSWQKKFDPPLLAAAEKLLGSSQPATNPVTEAPPEIGLYAAATICMDDVSLGAEIVSARGGRDQAPAVLAAADRALQGHLETRPRPNVLLVPPNPLLALTYTMDALRSRGWLIDGVAALNATPYLRGPGGRLAFFRQLADPKISKPAGDVWRHAVLGGVYDGSPILRENAFRAIPQPLTDDWEQPVRAALEDRDGAVVYAACQVAGASGRKSFVQPLVRVVESVHNLEIRQTATTAAVKLGAGVELWQVWCELIPQEGVNSAAVAQLIIGTIDLPFGGSFGTNSMPRDRCYLLRDAWRIFLTKNRARLESGKRVPPYDPSVTPALTGLDVSDIPAVSVGLKDGTQWPPPKPSPTARPTPLTK